MRQKYLSHIFYVLTYSIKNNNIPGEVDDLQVDLEKEKTMVNSLQNQQKKFDATLNKERERADGLEGDKDAYEKKCRDLESKVLSLQAELEDNNEKLSDSERIRKQVSF